MPNLSREQQLIILGLVLVIISGLGVMAYRRLVPEEKNEIVIEEVEAKAEAKAEVIVHVAGAVGREGVYRLEMGKRTIDAVKLAGGASPNADLSILNLAEKVKDGQKIMVPEKAKIVPRELGYQGIGVSGKTSAGGKVSINSAGEAELCKVPGIGPSTAKRIIEHRSQNGPFSKIEDLMKVKGIGKGKFEKMKESISL